MSRIDWILMALIFLGIIMFLYGANYYNEIIGWTGVFLFVGGTVAFVFLYLYNWITKRDVQKP